MTDLVVADAEPAVLLANLDQFKKQITINRDVHDSQLELYLQSASNVVRGMVVVDLTAIPPEATLATLMYAQYLWELTQRRSARRNDDDPDSILIDPRPEMRRLLQPLPTVATMGPLFSFPDALEYPER